MRFTMGWMSGKGQSRTCPDERGALVVGRDPLTLPVVGYAFILVTDRCPPFRLRP
jgi:hypothetical protein